MAKKLEKKGVPAYMVTLGDMWSLMLTFFIMLFAMSEVDATKFKKIQGTMKNTFGYKQAPVIFGPPPGISLITGSASSDSSGTEVMFDQPANNSIIDPQLQSLRMQACERQVKKDAIDKTAAKKHSAVIRRILSEELKAGLFTLSDQGKEVSLLFSGESTFSSATDINVSMKKALLKLGVALGATSGTVLVRGYVPPNYKGQFKSAYEESSARTAVIGTVLMDSTKVSADRIQVESMSNKRAPSSIKAFPESVSVPFFEVSVVKD